MAYTWEPRWEPYRVSVYGIMINTCRDKITKMIACPICIHAASKCLELTNKQPDYPEKLIFFFTEEDLITHIREVHGLGFLRKKQSGVLSDG